SNIYLQACSLSPTPEMLPLPLAIRDGRLVKFGLNPSEHERSQKFCFFTLTLDKNSQTQH
ncbi:hypothetical protein, partial [Trichormus variabilis]|uniref:hypothetical protein n=1 Tax=Anabaena variabilis TaxID=264691 RepID=UPI001A931EA4